MLLIRDLNCQHGLVWSNRNGSGCDNNQIVTTKGHTKSFLRSLSQLLPLLLSHLKCLDKKISFNFFFFKVSNNLPQKFQKGRFSGRLSWDLHYLVFLCRNVHTKDNEGVEYDLFMHKYVCFQLDKWAPMFPG